MEEDKKKITLVMKKNFSLSFEIFYLVFYFKVIKELDEKKKQALRTAWDQVKENIKKIEINHLLRSTKTLGRSSQSFCRAQLQSSSHHRVRMFSMGSRSR